MHEWEKAFDEKFRAGLGDQADDVKALFAAAYEDLNYSARETVNGVMEKNRELRARIKQLEAALDGDPNMTATPEQRREWRASAVRYADKLEEENKSLRAELEQFRATLADNEAYGLTLIQERNDLRAKLERSETALERGEETCEWTPDNDPDWNTWNSQCGQSWVFEESGPAENDMRFCPFCGRLLVAVLPVDEGGEE